MIFYDIHGLISRFQVGVKGTIADHINDHLRKGVVLILHGHLIVLSIFLYRYDPSGTVFIIWSIVWFNYDLYK